MFVYLKTLTTLFSALSWARLCVFLILTWVVLSRYEGVCLCMFTPSVGCYYLLRGHVLVYFLIHTWVVFSTYVAVLLCIFPLRGLFLALSWARSRVFLTITWVISSPYVGAFMCIFNPYVGCF